MRVVVAGSSGFLGTNLTERLRADGHEVVRLVRQGTGAADEAVWDPYVAWLDPEVVESCDVVVNLAGSPTTGNPHSRRWARTLRVSRVATTSLLARTIAESRRRPAFLAGNGISYYGDHGTEPVTERSASEGDAFLTRVTRAWEAAAVPASDAGARVCVLRTAPVMDRRSEPLRQLARLFRLGLGARVGDGHQHFPMISLRDWVGAVSFLVASPDLAGPVNLCCPVAPTNQDFTQALAAAVGRRARLVAPRPVVAVAAGVLSPEVLGSVNARPAALLRAGYQFADTDVRDVLAAGLGRV